MGAASPVTLRSRPPSTCPRQDAQQSAHHTATEARERCFCWWDLRGRHGRSTAAGPLAPPSIRLLWPGHSFLSLWLPGCPPLRDPWAPALPRPPPSRWTRRHARGGLPCPGLLPASPALTRRSQGQTSQALQGPCGVHHVTFNLHRLKCTNHPYMYPAQKPAVAGRVGAHCCRALHPQSALTHAMAPQMLSRRPASLHACSSRPVQPAELQRRTNSGLSVFKKSERGI